MTTVSSTTENDGSPSFDALYKVLIVGDEDSGARSIFNIIPDDNQFSSEEDFKVKYFDIMDLKIKFEIWDTCKGMDSRRILQSYLVNARGALLVYNKANRSAFLSIRNWHSYITHHCDSHMKIVLVAQHRVVLDGEEETEVVSDQEGKDLAMELGMAFCSIKEGDASDVETAFGCLYREMGNDMGSLSSIFNFCNIS